MPKEVKSAFKATLEEINEADVILIVLDVSHPDHRQHRQTVEAVLGEIRRPDQALWIAYNKIDLVTEPMLMPGDGYLISARTGFGVETLLEGFFRYWIQNRGRFVLKFSKSEQRFADKLDEWSMVLRRWYEGDRFCVDIVVLRDLIEPFLQRTGVEHEALPLVPPGPADSKDGSDQ
jgi:GTP-binding protein HflX